MMVENSSLKFEYEFLTPDEAAELLRGSRDTIYDMNYRKSKYNIPDGMFVKVGRKLLIRQDVFRQRFFSRA